LVKDIEKLLVILKKLGLIAGRTRFQKIIFLLKNKDSIEFDYNFISYYYGPYSAELQLEINLLEAAGLVQVIPQDGTLYMHLLTSKGKSVAKEIEQKMEPSEKRKLEEALRKYRRKPTSSLIREAKLIAVNSI